MKNRNSTILNVMVVSLLALAMNSWAQEENTVDPKDSDKQDQDSSEEASEISKEVSVGMYYLDQDSYRFGKYSGLTDKGAYALVDFKIEKRPDPDSSDVTRWRVQGWRLGLDSRRLEFDYKQQGVQSFNAHYREIPNYRFSDGQTPFLKQSAGEWNLPSNWDVAPGSSNTRGFNNLQESLVNLKVDTKRRRMDLSYARKLGGGWGFDIDYRYETKTGERTLGSIFGYSGGNPRGMILAAPVDYSTSTITAMMGYANSRFQVNFGIYGSFFDNDKDNLVFQNPYGHQSQWASAVQYPDSYGRIALEPDNSYLQFRINGAYNMGNRSRLTADFSYGQMKQNDQLQPYTINPDLLVHTPVTLNKLNAKVNTTMFNARWSSTLARNLSLALNYRYNERDNKTPREVYPYIGADSQDQRAYIDGRINLPYSYKKRQSDAIVSWRFAKGARLKAGVDYRDYDRDYMEVKSSDEFAWLAGISYSGWGKGSLKVNYRHSDRDVSEYVGNWPLINSHLPGVEGEDDWENHPMLRKYFLTDRERDQYSVRADYFPVQQFNLGFAASYSKDDYDDGYFGLNEAKINSWTIDGGWYPRENVVLTGFYTNESFNSSQSSRTFRNTSGAANPANNWWADSDDNVDTYNVALSFTDIGADRGWNGVEVGMDYTFSDMQSGWEVTAVSAATEPMPDLISKMKSFSFWTTFATGDRSNLRLVAENAELKTQDWGLDNVVPGTLSNVLLLGESAANYDLWLFSASWSYRF